MTYSQNYFLVYKVSYSLNLRASAHYLVCVLNTAKSFIILIVSNIIAQLTLTSGQTVALLQGDLTEEHVDAIVNAANERLAHGGGLAAAIVRKGGREIQAESDDWVRKNGTAKHDRAALTSAGRLPCKFIIHAVGPMWGSGDEDAKLCAAYIAALEVAHVQNFTSIAFPSISTGIFGFPVQRAAPLAVQAMLDFYTTHPSTTLREIRFTLIDAPTVDVFRAEFEKRQRSAWSVFHYFLHLTFHVCA